MTNSANCTAAKASRAVLAVTGKRYCAYHDGHTDAHNGTMHPVRNGQRFICFPCQEKRKVKR